MSETKQGEGQPEGAILSEDQIKRLKISIAIMSALLVAGIVTLIARVIYLANRGDSPSAAVSTSAASAALLPDLRLFLPADAQFKSTSLNGNRLIAHYATPQGEGMVVLDLTTGKQSNVAIRKAPF